MLDTPRSPDILLGMGEEEPAAAKPPGSKTPDGSGNGSPDPVGGKAQGRGRRLASRLRITALLASSALLGGIAVVVWHRRALEQMRQAGPAAGTGDRPPDEFI